MKKIIFIILFGLTAICCKNKDEVMSGDLFIKYIDIGSLYPLSKEEIDIKIESNKKTLNVSEEEKGLVAYFLKLKEDDLIDKPHFNLRIDDGSVLKIFTYEDQYHKLKKFDWKLLNSEKKLSITAIVIKTKSGYYFAKEILKVKLMKGKTYSRK